MFVFIHCVYIINDFMYDDSFIYKFQSIWWYFPSSRYIISLWNYPSKIRYYDNQYRHLKACPKIVNLGIKYIVFDSSNIWTCNYSIIIRNERHLPNYRLNFSWTAINKFEFANSLQHLFCRYLISNQLQIISFGGAHQVRGYKCDGVKF
jgi:hypothetical protein